MAEARRTLQNINEFIKDELFEQVYLDGLTRKYKINKFLND